MPTVMSIVGATSDLLNWVTQNLRPTPDKPHYSFNLRDCARLIFSHLLVKRENVDSKKVFIRLWVHEALRVFSDRLVEQQDRVQLIHRLRFAVKEFFKESFDVSLDNLMPKGQEEIGEENLRQLIFTTVLTPESSEERKYEEVGSLDHLLKGLTVLIESYNSTQSPPINVVLYKFALEHLCRLCQVLSINGGSCVLLGLRGSGRQTLSRLAAILCKAHFYQPSIVHNYGFSEWRADLKQVLIQAGGNNAKTVYFISENELRNELFLQDVDMILSTGQVPDMFSASEMEQIFEMVRLAAQGGNRNLDINPYTVHSFFVSRCRQNLHIILSSISHSFRKWIYLYPSILKYCTIDWIEPYNTMTFNGKEYKLKDWPEEALEKIALHCWDGMNLGESVKASVVTLCKYIHVSAREATEKFYSVTGRKCHVTSASYLTMVKKYRSLVTRKQEEIKETKAKFTCGLEKLELATSQVSVIQKELETLQPQLEVAAKETAGMMEVIDKDTVTIDEASGLVRVDEHVAKVQAAAANDLKTECEADLALAIPILEEAVAALNTLKPTDITLVKSMKNPPDTVKLVMAAVCVMKDIKPEKIPDPNNPGRKILDYWGPSKRLLGDMAFLQQLKDYDKDNIPPAVMSMIRKHYLPNKDFKPHIVAKASSAAEGLCKWVIAMDMYDAVAKEVAPKKVKLEIAEKEFAATMAVLEEKRAQVRLLEERLRDLHVKLEAAQQRKKVLENEVGLCENKLSKARTLIDGLAGEKDRWKTSVLSLQTSWDNLAGDILVTCGVIAYLAPLTSSFRISLIKDWCDTCITEAIPISTEYDFIKVLSFDQNISNLPNDDFSIENAAILEYTNRCPLIIDPQGLASSWIKVKEKTNCLQVIRISDNEFMKSVEASLDAGNPVLLENVDEQLNSIILNPVFVRGYMEDADKKRSIYLTTRLQNPSFSATVYNNFSVINFTLTVTGLEDKLLDIIVTKERPDLQERKQMMIITSSENKTKLKEIENRILETLSFTKGNILENENAVNILNTAKTLLVEIKEKQKEFKLVEEEVHSYCQQYLAVVEHSARLYFCLTNLINIDYMYQFSLDWFLKTYTTSIETANRSQVVEVRLQYLEERITYNLFKNVCRSLVEKHRIIFALLLCTTIELANKTIQEDDLNFFLYGTNIKQSNSNNPASDWLPDSAWIQICCLDNLSAFAGFRNHFETNHREWKALQLKKEKKLPTPWNLQLSSFEKLILFKIIFPDELTECILDYIEESMGPKYAILPSLDVSCSFEESNCLTPLLFILSPGSNPVVDLYQMAASKQITLQTLSLGVAQEEAANALIKHCREEGNWACLENCHLLPNYMASLETLCDGLSLHNTNMEFRLWLTCRPTWQFPASILQSSIKMATDLCSGLKKRMFHSYLSEPILDDRFFYGCPGKDRAFAKLLYSISFLHAFVQERKKYNYLGWNCSYEFTPVDFHTSLIHLQMYVQMYKDIPYDILQYVVGECNYGGRVHDSWDHRLLTTIVTDMINIKVTDSPDYRLSQVSDKFQVPLRFEYHDFIVSIQELPDNSTSEVFGLNLNVEIQYNNRITQEIFDTLKMLQPNGTKETNFLNTSLIDLVDDILQKLPENVSLLAEESAQSGGSLGVILRQETLLYSSLLLNIRTSLNAFKEAMLGLGEPPPDFELMGSQLYENKIPSSWLKQSYPTCKNLGAYVDDLLKRLAFLESCQQKGYQQEVWLPGIFSPRSLVVASLHTHSVNTHTPLHLLTFDHIVLDIQPPSEPYGLITSGLHIQGAVWDSELAILQEQPLRKFSSQMPRIWFKPCFKTEVNTNSRYVCPVYNTSTRDNYVSQVMLTSAQEPSHWIYRGVVLLCQEETS